MTSLDFERAARFIAAVPAGRWTSFGDVAAAAGNERGAMAVGEWLRRSGGSIPYFWRVLRTDGLVPEGLRGGGVGLPHDAAEAREVLRGEELVIDGHGRAAQRLRFRPADWIGVKAGAPELADPQSNALGSSRDSIGLTIAAPAPKTDHSSLGLHRSDSSIQRKAETAILAKVSEHFGTALAPKTVTFESGARVRVDGGTADDSIFVEVFARQGALKGGQKKKVCQDALKLITVGRSHPNAELVLAFADLDAAAYASKGTWVSEALATWGVAVLVVSVDETLRADIRSAQVRQIMVNPSAASADGASED